MMRILPLTALLFTVSAAAPAEAQTFGGNGPYCMQYFQWGGSRNIDCSYSTIAQCQATASGLSAMCLTNPSYANARAPRHLAYRRSHRY